MVAQQILSILSALSAGVNKFVFEGKQISLVWSCGIFITMNPGTQAGMRSCCVSHVPLQDLLFFSFCGSQSLAFIYSVCVFVS